MPGQQGLSITCPVCGESFPVPGDVLAVDGHTVVVRLDRSDVYGHLPECAARAGERAGEEAARERHPAGKGLAKPEVSTGPLVAPQSPLVAPGRRACVMCATDNAACMGALRDNGLPCCGACGEGNTHPTPGEDRACAVWAAEHGARP